MDDSAMVKILFVEDNPRDAELTIRALRRQNLANYLFHVRDGVEALDFLFGRGRFEGRVPTDTPQVVLLDLKLPKLSGLEVLRIIKVDERLHTIPVVIVTSSREDPDIRTAYSLGANSYVVKPVEFDSFMEVMNRLGYYWLKVNHTNAHDGR